jgi:molybdate transport system substrate-binding protein
MAVLSVFSLTAARADDLKIAAAANLQKVMTEALIPAFQKKTGQTVTPTFGATKMLAEQLSQGAPLDVFVAADTVTVDGLASQGLVLPSSERVYAFGRLVMWTRHDARLHPKKIEDLAKPGYTKISIANPATAPYGLAAQQSFSAARLTSAITPKLVQAENIGQALQFAQSGNADVALTALSLVIEDKADPYVIVPDKLHAPIAQSAAVVKGAPHPQLAQQFLDFLTGKDAASIWKRYGYNLPGKKKG